MNELKVTDSEKLLLATYRMMEAMAQLRRIPKRTFWEKVFRQLPRLNGVVGMSEASLWKGMMALGIDMRNHTAIMNRKPEVKEIEKRLFDERS